MLQVIGNISQEKQQNIIKHLTTLKTHPDVSNYAGNRLIVWIGKEPFLGRDRSRDKLGVQDTRIMNYCTQVFGKHFKVDYILVSFSGTKSAGIKWHRDAAYASDKAGTINLGSCSFGYQDRQGGNEKFYQFTGGEVMLFHSKHPHCCDPSPNRWAIHCWQGK